MPNTPFNPDSPDSSSSAPVSAPSAPESAQNTPQTRKQGFFSQFMERQSRFRQAFGSFLRKQQRLDPFRFWAVGALLFIAFFGASNAFFGQISQQWELQSVMRLQKISLAQMREALEKGQIQSIISHDLNEGGLWKTALVGVTEFQMKDGERRTILSAQLSNDTIQKNIYEQALKQDIEFKKGHRHSQTGNRLTDFLFFILNISLFVILILIFQRAMGDILTGKNFNPKVTNETISFQDIVGYDEIKREFTEVIDQMKRAKTFANKGIRAPKGMLLTGSPGVGKTMFAKALANECKAKFLYATGSDFVELYVGVGAKRARSLFSEARLNSPAIIFIDEIDALGARDAYGMDAERLSTINQFLAEMDGFSENGAVLVVGATNYPERLDPAMMRPGRFDKKIHIPNPDMPTREGILRKYLSDVPCAPDLDFKALALRSSGMSGADLSNWCAEAKQLAFRGSETDEVFVESKEMDEALEILYLGLTGRKPSEKENIRVAYHELGHALIGKLLCPHLAIDKVAVGGRGSALGFTMQRPLEEQNLYSKTELLGQICGLLGGRAAEEIFLGEGSSGAADDLSKANDIARKMICDLGMGPGDNLLTWRANPRDAHTPPERFQADAQKLLLAQLGRAKSILEANRAWMETTCALLLSKKSLNAEELFPDNLPLANPEKDEQKISA